MLNKIGKFFLTVFIIVVLYVIGYSITSLGGNVFDNPKTIKTK